jgi:FkbM family methyltransferase
MFPLKRLIEDNLPSAKPELWADVSSVMWRRFAAWVNTRFDSEWPNRPLITTLQADGLMLEVVPADVIGKPIARFGVYEFAVSKLVREYLKPGDVFVDVGANIGYYTVIAAGIVGRSGLVHAFEPNSRVRARLERNVVLNGLTQVRIRPDAVSSRSGFVRLVEPQNTNNDGLAYVDSSGGTAGTEVPSVRLDELPELRERPPALIKVDVEGGEPEVYRGASSLLDQADAPSILFESFEIGRDASILRAHGFQVFQPILHSGALRLTIDLDVPPYRRWEAPNFLAVKSVRGRRFVETMAVP